MHLTRVENSDTKRVSLFWHTRYYIRQVNEVNGGAEIIVRCVSVCVCAADRWVRVW